MTEKRNISTVFTSVKSDCTGCGACAQVCGKTAINMSEDEEGFFYPKLDCERCVSCGLCDRICPVVNDHKTNNYTFQKSFLATTPYDRFYYRSATIGVCTMASEWVINNGGMVFGAYLEELDWRVKHIRVSTKEDIEKIRNSKYAQSDTGTTYTEVRALLKQNKTILYVGTPCQIAGLKAFLRCEYETLYTIDLICHGVYSYKLLQLEVDYWQKKFNAPISRFRFRSKYIYPWSYGGVINFDIYKRGKYEHIERHGSESPTYYCYAYSNDGYSHNLREVCYRCPFREKGRYGDLTVGDPWGTMVKYKRLFTSNNKKKGVTLIFSNTEKGDNLLNKISDLLYLNEIPLEDAFKQSALLSSERKATLQRQQIYQILREKGDYGKLISTVMNVNFKAKHRQFRKKVLRDKVEFLLKKLLKGERK